MSAPAGRPAAHRRPAALEAIILYKLIKAALEALSGVAAIVLLAHGAEAFAASLAEILLEHFAGAWALKAATALVVAATPGRVKIVAGAAFADAVLTAIEGLALQAGRWWAPWLVVIATATLLPWEVWEIVRHARWGRVALLVVNLAVVAYLVRHALRHHRAHKLARPGAPLPRRVDRPADGP